MHLQLPELNGYVDWIESTEDRGQLIESVGDDVLRREDGGEVLAYCLAPFKIEVYRTRCILA